MIARKRLLWISIPVSGATTACSMILAVCLSLVISTRAAEAQVVPPDVVQKAIDQGTVSVIVHLEIRMTPEGLLENSAAVRAQRQRIASAQEHVLTALAASDHRVHHRYETVPLLALEVSARALAVLDGLRGIVAHVDEDRPVFPTLAESVPLIEGNAAWAAGVTGRGRVVAVIDSGVDKAHPFLAGKVVEEACYSTDGACPNGSTSQIGAGAGVPCPYPGCYHGTHVAGIAAGSGPTFSGVAKDANIMAVQVFHQTPDGISANTGDIVAALVRVYSLRNLYDFAAVNMSLGTKQGFSSPCDAFSPYKPAIDNLRSVGIATVISSGNEGLTNAISSPACVSTAVSVGSTNDSDAVSTYSNSASFLSLLAPGDVINSSMPGGFFANLSGTSMAAPHVAGAWAILKQGKPSASVSETLSALQSTGLPVTDARNGIVKPRIRVFEALKSLVPAVSSPIGFYTARPCRLIDTRGPVGAYGGPALRAGAVRQLSAVSRCNIPLTATAISVNVAVVSPDSSGHLVVYSAGSALPSTTTINYRAGQTRTNNAIIALGGGGGVAVRSGQPSGTVHFILDVNGYFARPGLLAWWPGDGNANDVAGSSDGSLGSGATYVAGRVGQAFQLDGIDDYVDLGSSNIIGSGNAPFTVSFWMKPGGTLSNTYYLPVRLKQDTGFFVVLAHNCCGTTGDYLWATFRGHTQWALPVSQASLLNRWTHVSATYNGGSKDALSSITIYLDGAPVSTVGAFNAGPAGGSCNDNALGSSPDGLSCAGSVSNYPIAIDEVQVYDRPLLPLEIEAIHSAGPSAWWPGEGNADDVIGSNIGTLGAGATFGSGHTGQAFRLDGMDDYVDLGPSSIIGSGNAPFTVSFWMNPGGILSNTYYMPIRLKQDSGFFLVFAHNCCGTTGDYAWTSFRQHQQWAFPVSQAALLNRWTHVSATYDGGNKDAISSYTLYLDGVPISNSSAVNAGPAGGTCNDNALGSSPEGLNCAGSAENYPISIDEVQIFNRSLAPLEIEANHSASSLSISSTSSTRSVGDHP
jgi:subtilisin